MRQHRHIQGSSTEDMLASVDGLLDSILRKPRREVTTIHFVSPFCLCLDQSEVGKGFFTVAGTISNLAIDIDSCEKDTELIIQLFVGETITTKRFKVKKGLTKIEGNIPVLAFTKLSMHFSIPVINANIGYTFVPERGKDETAPVPT